LGAAAEAEVSGVTGVLVCFAVRTILASIQYNMFLF
jgi:hypothetical protein